MAQQNIDEGKIPITISLKYSVYLDELEKAVETKFENVDLIQVGNYTSNYSDEYAQQLANDDLTDIVVTWPLDGAARNCEDRLIDLSGLEVTSRYHLSTLNSISQNGKLYYLPGPTQLRGIVANKTMMEENGWEIPQNYEEFVALCEEIEASGVRSLQLSFWNKEVLRYSFMGFGYTQSFSTPKAAQALESYNAGKGSFADFALPAFECFEEFVAKGIFKPDDLEVRYPIREQMLMDRECVMVSDGMNLVEKLKLQGCTDEFVILPFFNKDKSVGWGQLTPTQYIGLNANLQKPENKAKYELTLQILDFISTPEGQLALANRNVTNVSSLINNTIPDSPELVNMREVVENGQYTAFPSYTNIEEELYQALAAMLRGEIDRSEAIERLDKVNGNPVATPKAPKIGTATKTFSLLDTGNYVTDVMRAHSGADVALFLDNGRNGSYNARGISARFYKGDILESDVTMRVLPVLQHGEQGFLNVATMSGDNLLKTLEYNFDDGDWFYYFSGLRLVYDYTAERGSRIKSITDTQGKPIEPDQLYTVAIMEGTVRQEWVSSLQTTNELVKDILISDIKEKGSITPVSDNRIGQK